MRHFYDNTRRATDRARARTVREAVSHTARRIAQVRDIRAVWVWLLMRRKRG